MSDLGVEQEVAWLRQAKKERDCRVLQEIERGDFWKAEYFRLRGELEALQTWAEEEREIARRGPGGAHAFRSLGREDAFRDIQDRLSDTVSED